MSTRWLLLGLGVALGTMVGYLLAASPAQAESPRVPAWLEVMQRVCTSVGGLGTFAALIFVARQFSLLQAQSELVQKNILASLDSQLYSRLDVFNKFVADHDAEYEMLRQPFGPEPQDHRARLHRMCDLAFTFYEQVYKHHVRYNLLDTEDWDEWQHQMAHFFAKPYVRGYWRVACDRQARRFRDFIDSLMESTGHSG
jgi:hypothetical protein